MAGRPSDFTQELADSICDKIADGVSVRKICEDDDMPDRNTIMRWENNNPEFYRQITRARAMRAENEADSLEEINQMVMSGKLKADAASVISGNRKWAASKLAPKRYGEKLQVGGDDDLPAIKTEDVTNPELAARKIAAMMAAMAAKKE